MRIVTAAFALCLTLLVHQSAQAQSPFSIQSAGNIVEEGLATLWSDIDGDSDADLLIVNVSGQHTLFRNDGSGGLNPEAFVLPTQNVGDGVFADLDGDGDRDLVLGSLDQSGYYVKDASGYTAGLVPGLTDRTGVRSVNPVDANGDGRLDLFVSRRGTQGNYLLTQTVDGSWEVSFTEPSKNAGSTNQTCWSDADLDGDLDAFVVNSAGRDNVAYRNDDGDLVEWTVGAEQSEAVAATSCAWGDVDADGDFDLFITAVGAPSRLYLNDGTGMLAEAPPSAAPALDGDVISARWDDIDLDGDLDLIAVGRFEPLRLYLNEGGVFVASEIAGLNAAPSYRTGAATFDLDGDGDLELAVGAGFNGSYEPSVVYRNDLAGAPNWIGVRLVSSTTANTDGIGARITVYSDLAGDPVVQLREILAHSSRLGQSDMTAMFGLGANGKADSVRVDWPSGSVSTVYPETQSQVLVVEDPTAVSGEPVPGRAFAVSVRPNPSGGDAVGVVTLDVAGEVALALFDALGREVWSQVLRAPAGAVEVRLPQLATGTYVFRARTDRQTATRLLTVVR